MMKRTKTSVLLLGVAVIALMTLACLGGGAAVQEEAGIAEEVAVEEPPTAAPEPTDVPEPTEEVQEPPVLPDDWTLYEVSEGGFRIGLPPGWSQIDMDPETIEASMDAVAEQNPEIGEWLEGQVANLAAQGIKFYGFDLSQESVSSGFMTNVNVNIVDIGVEISVDDLAEMNAGTYEEMFNLAEPVQHEMLSLPAGDAALFEFDTSMASPTGEEVAISFAQYIFVHNKASYVLTFATGADRAESYKDIFRQIAESFGYM
jgi:hypothetical protein